MANYSRDSFQDTGNAFAEMLGLPQAGGSNVRSYVSVRLQQAVPVLDADWNEESDIRRRELELLLARAIGDGVPAGSDGFAILANEAPNNFSIGAGILFNKGWLVYNRNGVNYDVQPNRNAAGVAPGSPAPLQTPTQATTYLVYLDAWETEISSQTDSNLLDSRIGIETCLRLERVWVVRVAALAANTDPLDPGSIPTQQPGHRYYPLATIDRSPSDQIAASMIKDLRRTHLSLEALTHAPLRVYDALRDQNLDSTRLALAFQGNLSALAGVLELTPEVFVYNSNPQKSARALAAMHDTRASATSFQQQAQLGTLHRRAALGAMQTFFNLQTALLILIKRFKADGLATGSAADRFIDIYERNLNGSTATDPDSMGAALTASDVLAAVMAQERLNQELGLPSNVLPVGSLALTPINVAPTTAVTPNTEYRVTLRLQSLLSSTASSEAIQVIASAGPGWSVNFQDARQSAVIVTLGNGQTTDLVLVLKAATGAASTKLKLTARPQRRQQLVYQTPAISLAIGQPIVAAPIIVTLTYTGPQLQPDSSLTVPRSTMANDGMAISFRVTNLSVNTEQYDIAATPQGTATGWQPISPVPVPPLGSTESRTIRIDFKITDLAGAVSPLTYQFQVFRVTSGSTPQPNAVFSMTFKLT